MFTITLADTGKEVKLDIKPPTEDIFCTCESPVGEYVKGAHIEGVGYVKKHGYICRKCGKFVQIG